MSNDETTLFAGSSPAMRTIFPSTNGATTRSLKPRATRSRPSATPVRSATASALTTWRRQQPLAERQTCIRLNRRFRSADALTIEPRPIEAANASLPGSEHRAGIVDPARASLWLLGGGDPLDPISARDGRDVRPQRPRFRGGRESLPQICRHLGFRFLSRRRDLQRDDVASVCARSFAHLPVHSEPMASLAVWLECGSKGEAIDGAFDRRHAPRGELRTGVLWQGKKGPRADLRGRRRPEEFRAETDIRSGLGHFCLVSLIGIYFWDAARFTRSTMSDSMLVR